MTTHNVLECARLGGTRQIVFASTSTVYGIREKPMAEDSGPLFPVSLYGAGKLAAEAFLSAFAALFDMKVWIFRLPNVVGARMTHGAVHDFIDKLRRDPSRLLVLGDGTQRKPCVLVGEVIDAMLLARECARERVNCFNIGVESATWVRDMAQIVIEEMDLGDIPVEYTGGAGGWAGDVPHFEFDLTRIHRLGWRARHSSDEAVRLAARSQIEFTRTTMSNEVAPA
jgi:UDP-glucose 4-epimerase